MRDYTVDSWRKQAGVDAAGTPRVVNIAPNIVGVWENYKAYLSRGANLRSEEHTSELQSLMRISYAVFCLKKKNKTPTQRTTTYTQLHQHTIQTIRDTYN